MKARMSLQHDRPALLGKDEAAPVHESNTAGVSPFLLTCDHYGRADSARPRRSRCRRKRPRASHRLGHRHRRCRRGAFETARRTPDRATLFAAGDRLQPAAAGGKLDRAHQRSDAYTRQRKSRCRSRQRAAAIDLRSLPPPYRRGDRSPHPASFRRCWFRCTASRQFTPEW